MRTRHDKKNTRDNDDHCGWNFINWVGVRVNEVLLCFMYNIVRLRRT